MKRESTPPPKPPLLERLRSLLALPWRQPTRHEPPRTAAYLLRFLPLPRKQRESLLGDLAEEYGDISEEHGKRHADVWYWWQVSFSFGPFLWQALSGWLVDIIRRIIT